jgi:hypothetical protein
VCVCVCVFGGGRGKPNEHLNAIDPSADNHYKQLDNLEYLSYVRSMIADIIRCARKMKSISAMGEAAFENGRMKLVKCYIRSIAETWTIRKVDRK